MLPKWRNALETSANLSGFDSRDIRYRPESKLVEEVVKEVLKKLHSIIVSSSDAFKGLIGMEKQYKKIESLLSVQSPNVLSIGLWGMGGIGKTILASVLYDQMCFQFESWCFLREESDTPYGLKKLRKKLISKLLEEENLDFQTPYSLDNVKKRLSHLRVLIVLDDASNSKHLSYLVSHDGNLFGCGSRILVTSRNQEVLRSTKADKIWLKVEQLNDNEALELFNLANFEGNSPTSDYIELYKKVVKYAAGNPLAIKEMWEMALEGLQKFPCDGIHKVLKISYDGLQQDEKDIFLDIACFFKGRCRDSAENILNCWGFFGTLGIDSLIDKSLITVGGCNNQLLMHDLLQEMGWEIILQESNGHLEGQSWLWRCLHCHEQ